MNQTQPSQILFLFLTCLSLLGELSIQKLA